MRYTLHSKYYIYHRLLKTPFVLIYPLLTSSHYYPDTLIQLFSQAELKGCSKYIWQVKTRQNKILQSPERVVFIRSR